ncbi:MAG: metallophosphoesterase [Bacteroidales bacterium]|nr:metallophosphoesterase [Bacteroidales bacterium]
MGRLFAISDIHGCFRPFYELVTRIIKLERSDKLILLGDYIDRGEQSREVIDFIIDLERKGFDIIPLAGNHELMLIEAYRDQGMLPLWFLNSGMTTLLSFGIRDIRDIPEQYIEFFTRLEYFKTVGDFLFVHAGFDDDAEDPFSDVYQMVWECRPFYKNPLLQDRTIIHGHRRKTIKHIKGLIGEKAKVIPIDTGCVYEKELGYGFLSALEVNAMNLISVPNY